MDRYRHVHMTSIYIYMYNIYIDMYRHAASGLCRRSKKAWGLYCYAGLGVWGPGS